MIKNEFCFPEYYINKIPICDDCNCRLHDTGVVYMTYPEKYEYKCDECGKTYMYTKADLVGEWRWRSI